MDTFTLKKNITKREKDQSEKTQKTLACMRTKIREGDCEAPFVLGVLSFAYIDLHLMPVDADDVVNVSLEDSKAFYCTSYKAWKRIGAVDPHDQETLTFIEQLEEEKGWSVELFVTFADIFGKIVVVVYDKTLLESPGYNEGHSQ